MSPPLPASLLSSPAAAGVLSTCPYCGVGCGVRATVQTDGSVAIEGDGAHPANGGRLCVKGSALGETLDLDGRLLYPQVRAAAGAPLERVSWDAALERVASGFRRIVDTHGPDAVAFYVSGQLLTEDYYIANKLMKGYIGSANIDTNSRLCMSSAVAGHKRAFGADLVPLCYDDLELADLIVLVGSNAAWCHPILFQRIVAARKLRPELKLIVIDPRRTATCEMADLHLPLKAGTDVWLFNGLLCYLERHGGADRGFVAGHTNGFEAALSAAQVDCSDPAAVARICKVAEADLLDFYQQFCATQKVVTAFSQGVNQSSAGTDKVNSIINCHLLGGRIGQPGMGPFSITGQPNAMGGREVGGLANMLAAHMDLDNAAHRKTVQTFWGSPTLAERPGLKAVELFAAIDSGRVKAVWIIATNPVVSLPDADLVRRALGKCELVVASDIVEQSDTNGFAHILLPATGWGEKDGTVTNSERRISRQRAFLAAPGEARPDWQILCEVGRRMGYQGFDFESVHQVFDEHARLSAHDNGSTNRRPDDECDNEHDSDVSGRRVFNLSGLCGIDRAQYDGLQPVQWPVRRTPCGASEGTPRLFLEHRYAHADGRARFVATAARSPRHALGVEYPLVLNSGRVRDQWHTMTRSGKSPRLAEHIPEPFLDIHPQDALLYGVREGALARVASRWGEVVVRVQHGGGITRGNAFVPIHWNDQNASDARIGAVVNPALDPISGQPEFKHTPVRIEDFPVSWHGFILSRHDIAMDGITHWTRIRGRAMQRFELAGREAIADHGQWARQRLALSDAEADWIEYEDRNAGVYRAAYLREDTIEACLFLSRRPDLPSRAWLAGLFAKDKIDEGDRIGLLSGQAADRAAETGPTVCSCFGVGRDTICRAIVSQQLASVAEVTSALRAGGNCGSCVPEIKKLLDAELAAPSCGKRA